MGGEPSSTGTLGQARPNQVWCIRCAYTGAATRKLCPRCGGDLRNNEDDSSPKRKLVSRRRNRLADPTAEGDPDQIDLKTTPAESCRSCNHWAGLSETGGFAHCSIIDMPSPAAYRCNRWQPVASQMAQRPASAQTQIGLHDSIGDGKPLMGGENGYAEKPGGRNPVTVPLVSQTCSSARKARR